ncbi:hypothetical protein CRD60_05220 [Bifidobacterium aemilianum]|uniref:Uncharacterized protein n=1 Tax=Bifidobacterium aemilianum TaxID=2493120 RepID=A0A366K7K4_9BIFI|nr:hypothetical protein CRD60_05220 [Bifidobacterium aemilianum]
MTLYVRWKPQDKVSFGLGAAPASVVPPADLVMDKSLMVSASRWRLPPGPAAGQRVRPKRQGRG